MMLHASRPWQKRGNGSAAGSVGAASEPHAGEKQGASCREGDFGQEQLWRYGIRPAPLPAMDHGLIAQVGSHVERFRGGKGLQTGSASFRCSRPLAWWIEKKGRGGGDSEVTATSPNATE